MVPQRTLAATSAEVSTVEGVKVLTITTTEAGTLASYSFTSEMKECTKIVLSGYFNNTDLSAIKYNTDSNTSPYPGFNSVKTVDMSDARFVKQVSAAGNEDDYYLFHNEASGTAAREAKAIENILKLCIWTSSIDWEGVSTPSNESDVTIYDNENAMNGAKETSELNSYAAYPNETSHYLKLYISGETWGSMSTVDPGGAITVDWNENARNNHLTSYVQGQTVKTKRYYKKVELDEPNKYGWYLCYPDNPSGTLHNGNSYGDNPVNFDITNLDAGQGSIGDYLWFYVYYTKTNGSWGTMFTRTTAPENGTYTPITHFLEDKLNDNLQNYNEGQTIQLKRYYQKRNADYAWELCTSGSGPTEGSTVWDGTALGADMTNMFRSYAGVGDYLSFDVYYTKNETRSWGDDSGPQNKEANFTYEYRNNHLMDYGRNDVVKLSEYNYFQLQTVGSGSESWKEIPFTDRDRYRIKYRATTPSELSTSPTPNVGDYGVVLKSMGKEKVFDGTQWVDAGSFISNYSDMLFSGWKETLEEATTSRYADTHISGQIFSNCRQLKEVNYLAGNVTGFTDHVSNQNFVPFKVIIYKDVTQIDASAFIRSTITDLEFADDYLAAEKVAAEKYYHGETSERPDYPKELTIGDNAFEGCVNLKGVEIPNRVVSIGTEAFKNAGNSVDVFKVSFERRCDKLPGAGDVAIDFDHDLFLGNGCFQYCEKLTALSLPIRLVSLGHMAFANTPNLTNVDIREDAENARLKTITSNAFLKSGLTSIIIPRSVTEIQAGAFQECFNIKTITFQKQVGADGVELPPAQQEPLIIRSGAFAGGTESSYELKKVEVKMHPTERLLVCEYNAFNFTSLVGQTNEASRQMAVLDFADEDWDYYQGDWKKGYAFSQSNLNLFKDGIDRATSQPTVKSEGLVSVLDDEPRNGWQQFAMSTTDREIVIPEGNYIRTYSTATPHYIPIIAGTGTYLYDIFRISAFSDGYVDGDDIYSSAKADEAERIATATKVTDVISDRQYVPAHTGLIMQIHGNSNDSYIVYQDEVPSALQNYESGYKEYTYPNNTYSDANLLWPSCDDATVSVTEDEKTVYKVVINPTDPYPIGKLTGNKYRIFGLWVEDNAFWRSEPDVLINTDMAYLKLRIDQFHWANEDSGTSPTYPSSGGSRIALVFANEDSETSVVSSPVITKESDDSYYTIQGVKLYHPQGRGMYIHNGKKVFVK